MSNPYISRTIYALLVVMNLAIGAFLIQLGAGKVPIPEDAQWMVPIVLAVLNGVALFLPRLGGELQAQQSDMLRAQGVERRNMVVVTLDEAAHGMSSSPPPDAERLSINREAQDK